MLGGSLIAPIASFTDHDRREDRLDDEPAGRTGHLRRVARPRRWSRSASASTRRSGSRCRGPSNAPTNDVVAHRIAAHVLHHAVGRRQPRQLRARADASAPASTSCPATVELTQDVLLRHRHRQRAPRRHAVGIGGRVGVMYRPQLAAAALDRRDVAQRRSSSNFTGTGDFDAPAPYRAQLPPDGDITTVARRCRSRSRSASRIGRSTTSRSRRTSCGPTGRSSRASTSIVPSTTGGTMTIAQPRTTRTR